MQNFLRTTAVVVICLATLCVPSFAQGNSHHDKAKHNDAIEDDDGYRDSRVYDGRHVSIVFSVHDREIIRDYYRHGSNLPPGLAKRGGNLPPGLAKQLQRNGTLPPGLQKRLTPFPTDLDRRLSPLPSIYRRGTIGGAVVIVDRRTQRIIDIVDDILRP
jgi:hypothetical protein